MAEQAALADPELVLDGWRDWGLALTGRPELLGAIPGGRTNRNYRLSAPGLRRDLLLRINHPDPARLGIDREQERRILTLTADAGLSRPVLYWDPGQRFVLFPFLEARTWSQRDMARCDQRRRLRSMLERLAAIRPRLPRRRYHAYLLHYWRVLEQSGGTDARLQRAWADFIPRLQAFDAAPWHAGLTHHDLIPDNILDDGQRLWLIDWEYAAAGHPDIDIWTTDPHARVDPFIPEMMHWIDTLWEHLIRL